MILGRKVRCKKTLWHCHETESVGAEPEKALRLKSGGFDFEWLETDLAPGLI